MRVLALEVLLSGVLGIVLLVAAIPKLRHPRGFVLAVLEYRVLPTGLSWLYARLVPPLEFLLALLLLSGTAVRSAAIATSLLLLTFIVAVGINLARGRDLDCNCFGKARRPIGWRLVLQDAVLLGAAIVVAAMASEWVAPEPWSMFRLFGLVQAWALAPLLGSAALAACAAGLLGRSTLSRRRYGSGVVSKADRSRAAKPDTN